MRKPSTFEQALLDVSLEEFADIPPEDQLDVQFSAEFERKMAALIRNEQKRSWHLVNTRAKRILLIALLTILLLATTIAAVPALREGLIKFFTHDDGIAYTFTFDETDVARAPKEIEEIHAPSYIPEGYSLVDSLASPTASIMTYVNEAGEIISFTQNVIWSQPVEHPELGDVTMIMGLDSENSIAEYIVLDGYEVMEVLDIQGEGIVYLWTDHEYIYRLGFVPVEAGKLLDRTEAERILASVGPKK